MFNLVAKFEGLRSFGRKVAIRCMQGCRGGTSNGLRCVEGGSVPRGGSK